MPSCKEIISFFIFAVLFGILSNEAHAQITEAEAARTALKTGSSNELSEMFHNSFELVLLDSKYDKDKSEVVLKDFFTRYPANEFDFIHNGASKDGSLSYSIGHYTTEKEKYRVVIRFKKSSGDYKIHKLEVSEF